MNKTLKCKAVQYCGILPMKNSYAAPLCLLKLLAPMKCSGGVLDFSKQPYINVQRSPSFANIFFFVTPLNV